MLQTTNMKIIVLFFFLGLFMVHSQNADFSKEVSDIGKKYDSLWDSSKPTIVFTGSSSIRLWSDLEERFPELQILNTGFGGSEAHNLLDHLNDLVLDYNPTKVFIYEGDNDINSGKRPNKIIETFEVIISRIQNENPMAQLVLISPKPSISRWKLRGKYKRLNRKLEKLANQHGEITYVNVWDIMLNGRKLNKTLFIEDGLHMNKMGYDLWYNQLKEYVN